MPTSGLLSNTSMSCHIQSKLVRVSRLHEDRPWPSKLAHKAFTCAHIAYDTAARNSFEDIIAIPCYEMAVVDDVLLAFAELHNNVSKCFRDVDEAYSHLSSE